MQHYIFSFKTIRLAYLYGENVKLTVILKLLKLQQNQVYFAIE